MLSLGASQWGDAIGTRVYHDGQVQTLERGTQELNIQHDGVVKFNSNSARMVKGEQAGMALTHAGALDRASGIRVALAAARDFVRNGGEIRPVERIGDATVIIAERTGGESRTYVVYDNANIYNKALGEVAGTGIEREMKFGNTVHIIAEYVTGANCGAIEKNASGNWRMGRSGFEFANFTTFGELTSSNEVQRASRYNVFERRATTISFDAQGNVVEVGNKAIRHNIDISRLEVNNERLQNMRDALARGDLEALDSMTFEAMERSNQVIDNRQLAEYKAADKTWIEARDFGANFTGRPTWTAVLNYFGINLSTPVVMTDDKRKVLADNSIFVPKVAEGESITLSSIFDANSDMTAPQVFAVLGLADIDVEAPQYKAINAVAP
ncbi:MAG TPA: hypothetical protein PLV52_07345, partial [Candidatus Omnitrophota bacterium]|nr:hypothetical protein [Candidatus Omnitrophota bacterium]